MGSLHCIIDGDQLHKFCSERQQLGNLLPITKHLNQVAFVLYCILFVTSILTLRPGKIKYQLSHYMWSVVTVCLVVFQCKFFAANILNGLFWFLFPASTVVCRISCCFAFYFTNIANRFSMIFRLIISESRLAVDLLMLL